MTIERAIEILDPEHREHYESIEPVNEACRMGMEALQERIDRECGCEFCLPVSNADCELMKNFALKDDFSGKEIVDGGNHPAQYIRRYKKRYFLVTEFADDEGTCIVCEIKNCPMCGRNLHL